MLEIVHRGGCLPPGLWQDGPDCEVAEHTSNERAAHLRQRIIQLEQVCAPEFERVFVRLILGALWIVEVRRSRVFDMCTEDMGDRLVAREGDETLDAGRERRTVPHVQAAGIQGVASQQKSRAPIVERDRGWLVARNRNDVDETSVQGVD